MSRIAMLLLFMLTVQPFDAVKGNVTATFHNCSDDGGSGNSPHLFDVSEIYKCDEGRIEIYGRRTKTIEGGYVYEEEFGKPDFIFPPHRVTREDRKDFKWCPGDQPGIEKMCGDKPTKCWDGRMGTWDPEWQGYSCVTPDHRREQP